MAWFLWLMVVERQRWRCRPAAGRHRDEDSGAEFFQQVDELHQALLAEASETPALDFHDRLVELLQQGEPLVGDARTNHPPVGGIPLAEDQLLALELVEQAR